MAFQTLTPDPCLADVIDCLWTSDDHRPPHAYEHIFPSGAVEIVINLTDGELRCYDPEHATVRRMRAPVLTGVFERAFVVDTAQQRSMAGVRFKPGAAWRLLGAPVSAFTNDHADLAVMLGPEAAHLADRMANARSLTARLRMLHDALAGRLRRQSHPAVSWAVQQLCDHYADVRIGALVDESGLSGRRFNEVFAREVGLTPKAFLRVRRFRAALTHLGALGCRRTGSEVAAACGYSDEAHLIRDFRGFSGLTPAAFRDGRIYQPPSAAPGLDHALRAAS